MLARFELTPAAPLDELQRCRGARGDRCICPAERKTARRRDHPVSLTEVEQQRSVRLLGACLDPDPGAVRKRSQADRLGAGGAQSSSQLPGLRPPVRLRVIVTSSATRRALYNERNRPNSAARTIAMRGERAPEVSLQSVAFHAKGQGIRASPGLTETLKLADLGKRRFSRSERQRVCWGGARRRDACG